MEKIKGWQLCDWESFRRDKSGHDALVRRLTEIVKSKYHLKLGKLYEEECIAWRHGENPIFPFYF